MGSENSTDSVSFASNMAYRLKAGLRKMGRTAVVMVERIVRRPISYTTKMEMAMRATLRSDFVWEVTRGQPKAAEPELEGLFVRVSNDIPEEVPVETVQEEIPEPAVEKVYSTPSYATVSATSSEAMMYEFSSSRFDFDALDSTDDFTEYQPEVIEAPVFTEHIETEEEKAFYESLYEDLTVDAVLDYMGTIDLYESDRQKEYFESLYEDLEVEAVLAYMDTIELYARREEVQEIQMLAAPAMAGYIKAPVSNISGYLSAPVSAEAEEENAFYESLYEDLTVDAVLDYMDTIELYAKPAPEYVISEIAIPEECETTVEIEQPVKEPELIQTVFEVEQPVPAQMGMATQFVFGFDTPARAAVGATRFRFFAEEEEDDEDTESVQVMTYSGDAAVSAQSSSSGPLAL